MPQVNNVGSRNQASLRSGDTLTRSYEQGISREMRRRMAAEQAANKIQAEMDANPDLYKGAKASVGRTGRIKTNKAFQDAQAKETNVSLNREQKSSASPLNGLWNSIDGNIKRTLLAKAQLSDGANRQMQKGLSNTADAVTPGGAMAGLENDGSLSTISENGKTTNSPFLQNGVMLNGVSTPPPSIIHNQPSTTTPPPSSPPKTSDVLPSGTPPVATTPNTPLTTPAPDTPATPEQVSSYSSSAKTQAFDQSVSGARTAGKSLGGSNNEGSINASGTTLLAGRTKSQQGFTDAIGYMDKALRNQRYADAGNTVAAMFGGSTTNPFDNEVEVRKRQLDSYNAAQARDTDQIQYINVKDNIAASGDSTGFNYQTNWSKNDNVRQQTTEIIKDGNRSGGGSGTRENPDIGYVASADGTSTQVQVYQVGNFPFVFVPQQSKVENAARGARLRSFLTSAPGHEGALDTFNKKLIEESRLGNYPPGTKIEQRSDGGLSVYHFGKPAYDLMPTSTGSSDDQYEVFYKANGPGAHRGLLQDLTAITVTTQDEAETKAGQKFVPSED